MKYIDKFCITYANNEKIIITNKGGDVHVTILGNRQVFVSGYGVKYVIGEVSDILMTYSNGEIEVLLGADFDSMKGVTF